jgi:hypothetical protein
VSAHTPGPLEIIKPTVEEWEAVHILTGMNWQPKEGVLSNEYYEAHAQYLTAREKQIDWKIKHYGNLSMELKERDVAAAILRNREVMR